jgi:hypothetical protein
MTEETKDATPMLTDHFVNHIKEELFPHLIAGMRKDGKPGTPAVRIEVILSLDEEGNIVVASQDISGGGIVKTEKKEAEAE